jgi:tetratricopeptide (TPR) repeat protein
MATALGTRLRGLRIAKGLTQQELAGPHYTHAYISTIEAGRRQPSREALAHFAAKLEVDLDELETGRPASLETELSLALHEARIAVSKGRFKGARASFDEIEHRSHGFALIHVEALAEQGKALIAEHQGRIEEAMAFYDQALELLESQPPSSRAVATTGKARCLQSLGDRRYAIHIMESLIDEMERTRTAEPAALVRLHASLVLPYFDLALYAKAAEAADRAIALSVRVTEPATIAMMEVNVARVHLHQGKIDDANRALIRAEGLFDQLELQTEMGKARLARGYVLSRSDDLSAARDEFNAALKTFEATGSVLDQAYTLTELARIYRLQGRQADAIDAAERSISLLKGEADVAALGYAVRELGLAKIQQDAASAEKSLRQAIAYFEQSEERVEAMVTYRHLGDLRIEQGEQTAGCEAYRTGIMELERNL